MTIDQHTDEAAIHRLFDRMNAAWAAGDAKTYATAFTPDADYVSFLGTHYMGREAIVACHTPLFEKFQKGSHLDGAITQLRFVTPDVALVHSVGAVVKGNKRRTRRNTKVQTSVAVRQDGEWLFAAFQNTKYGWLLETLSTKFDSRMAPSVLVP
jgi:uncharacterized protein (TIGR02246 family)